MMIPTLLAFAAALVALAITLSGCSNLTPAQNALLVDAAIRAGEKVVDHELSGK